MEETQAYAELNKRWKSTCRIVFGGEVGELEEYKNWLLEYVTPPKLEKSCVSGNDVSFAVSDYAKGSKFIGFDEIDFGKKFQPLSINEVKDIDSILGAVKERAAYTGNIILGTSKFVEGSSNVLDSHFILSSSVVTDSKYAAYCEMLRKCEHMFGVLGDAQSLFTIKSVDGHRGNRMFECYTTLISTDGYYSMRCQDCRELMFSFGARSKSYIVGNLALPKEKYLQLKAKLLAEMREKLKKEKRLFSLLEVIQAANEAAPEIKLPHSPDEEKGDMRPMEEAFANTSALLFGKKLSGLDSYAPFLKRHVRQRRAFKSPFSGKSAYLAGYMTGISDLYKISRRFVTEDEMVEIGKHCIGSEALGTLRMEAAVLAKALRPIAYCALNDTIGTSHNLIDCTLVGHSENCYKVDGSVYAKKCAYCFWPRESEHIFGSWSVWESQFAMKAYYSKKLSRCLEVDNCESCADLYYSHNCENVHEGMFCFNAKNLRNAIGNAPLAPEKYKNIKSSILSQLANELENKKGLKIDIYNITAGSA